METIKCEVCGKEIPKDKAYEVGEDSGVYVCQECFENECVKCDRCGDTIFYDDAHRTHMGTFCESCYYDLFG